MEFLTFEDEAGIIETTFFPKACDCICHLVDMACPICWGGIVEQSRGAVTLTVNRVQMLTAQQRLLNLTEYNKVKP